jgi:hypothetical protein
MGEEVMAWVSFREGASATEDDLRAFCRERLAHFKVPRYWKVVAEFPMTVTGKVQKFKMREAAIEELGLVDAAAIGPRNDVTVRLVLGLTPPCRGGPGKSTRGSHSVR